jgi:hypothetical protein
LVFEELRLIRVEMTIMFLGVGIFDLAEALSGS